MSRFVVEGTSSQIHMYILPAFDVLSLNSFQEPMNWKIVINSSMQYMVDFFLYMKVLRTSQHDSKKIDILSIYKNMNLFYITTCIYVYIWQMYLSNYAVLIKKSNVFI